MNVPISKYHALGNSFLVLEAGRKRLARPALSKLAIRLCDVQTGVGADGILYLSASKKADQKIDVYNADGTWAEKSGNGLRICAVHMGRKSRKRSFVFEMGGAFNSVLLKEKIPNGYQVTAELGRPDFHAASVPVKTRQEFLINSPLAFGSVKIPVTCLSVGNPHTVLVVDNFDFDWQAVGAEIERDRKFPNGTNVEFVVAKSRGKILVADWERGAGATGSSGTGAAAAVCALVMLGLANRECKVIFDTGSLFIMWNDVTGVIELTGPVANVMDGTCEI